MDWLLSKNAEETNVVVRKVDVGTTEKKDLLCCEVVAVHVQAMVSMRRASNIYTKIGTIAHQPVCCGVTDQAPCRYHLQIQIAAMSTR